MVIGSVKSVQLIRSHTTLGERKFWIGVTETFVELCKADLLKI